MLSFAGSLKVFVALEACDLRKAMACTRSPPSGWVKIRAKAQSLSSAPFAGIELRNLSYVGNQ